MVHFPLPCLITGGYADDTILIARLHVFQHLAARIGLFIPGSKGRLLTIHVSFQFHFLFTLISTLPVSVDFVLPSSSMFLTHLHSRLLLLHLPVPSILVDALLSPPHPSRVSIFAAFKPHQNFQMKRPAKHRLLLPNDTHSFSMRISDARIKYLGHIFQHCDFPESIVMFHLFDFFPCNFSFSLQRSATCALELVLAKTAHKPTVFRNSPHFPGQFTPRFLPTVHCS